MALNDNCASGWSPVGTSSGHHNYITETFGFSHQIPFVWINALHADIPGVDGEHLFIMDEANVRGGMRRCIEAVEEILS